MEQITELELQSDAAEAALMGAVAFHADAIASVLRRLPGSDFYVPARGVIWDACRALSAARKPVGPAHVSRVLDEEGQFNGVVRRIITTEMNNASPAHYAEDHAAVVTDLARRRELIRRVSAARALVTAPGGDASDILAAIRSSFADVIEPDRERQGGTRSWSQMIAEFETAHAPGNRKTSIPTAWKELDQLIGGLFGGRLYVVGGSAGDGKSTAALNIASKAAHDGKHVLVFSQEMPVIDVFHRLVSAPAEVELAQINRRDLDEYRYTKVLSYARGANLPIRVNADPVNIAGVKTIAREARHRGRLDLLVVDYLQLIDSGTNARTQEEEIAKVSTALKRLAMELDIPLVVPAQLNRSPHARPDARPTKADLRGSGRIEQDADVVLLLWHEVDKLTSRRTGKLLFLLDKNRHGPKGEVTLEFNGGYGAIEEAT